MGTEQNQSERREIFGPEVLEYIADQYNIPELHFQTGPQFGVITDNAILGSEDGKKYFAKYYASEDPIKFAGFYYAAETVAINPDIPANIPLPNQQGTYTISVKGRSLALFPYIEHRVNPPQNDEEGLRLIVNAATMLGKIHATPVPADESLLKPLPRWTGENHENNLRRLNKIMEHINSLATKSDFDRRALDFAETKLALAEKIPLIKNSQPELSICHADLHLRNVLYDNDMNIVSIIDWDNSGLADSYSELLHVLLNSVVGQDYENYQTNQKQKIIAVLAAYQKALGKPLDVDRLKAAYPAFMLERVAYSWPVYQHYFEEETKNDNRLEPVLARSRFCREKYNEFLDFVLQAVEAVGDEE